MIFNTFINKNIPKHQQISLHCHPYFNPNTGGKQSVPLMGLDNIHFLACISTWLSLPPYWPRKEPLPNPCLPPPHPWLCLDNILVPLNPIPPPFLYNQYTPQFYSLLPWRWISRFPQNFGNHLMSIQYCNSDQNLQLQISLIFSLSKFNQHDASRMGYTNVN